MTDFTALMSRECFPISPRLILGINQRMRPSRPFPRTRGSWITRNPSLIASKTLSPWWRSQGPARPRALRRRTYPRPPSGASWWWAGAGWGRCCSTCSAGWCWSCRGSRTGRSPCPCRAGERRRAAPSAGRSSQHGSSRRRYSTRGSGLITKTFN